jgi:hypothetical protein
MRNLAAVLVAFVAGCGGGSMQLSTSSTPPNAGSDGSVGMPAPGGGDGTPTPGGAGGGGGTGGTGGGGSGGGGGGVTCPMTPTTVTQPAGEVTAMAVDDTAIYFVSGSKAIYRAPKQGGNPVWLANLPNVVQALTSNIVVDDSTVYFSDSGAEDGSTSGSIMAVPKVGGTARVLVAAVADACGSVRPTRLAVDGTTVYYTQTLVPPQPVPAGCSGHAQLMSVPKTGGSPTTLATRTDLYWLVIDATNAYMIDETNSVVTIPKAGGTLVQLGNSLGGDWKGGLAVDATNVYVTGGYGHLAAVRKVDGITVSYPVDTHDGGGMWPVTDRMGHVYWDESSNLAVINGDGTGLRMIGTPVVSGAVTLDDTSIYFWSWDGKTTHQIYRVCK